MRRILYTDDPSKKEAQREQGQQIINKGFLILSVTALLIIFSVIVASVSH